MTWTSSHSQRQRRSCRTRAIMPYLALDVQDIADHPAAMLRDLELLSSLLRKNLAQQVPQSMSHAKASLFGRSSSETHRKMIQTGWSQHSRFHYVSAPSFFLHSNRVSCSIRRVYTSRVRAAKSDRYHIPSSETRRRIRSLFWKTRKSSVMNSAKRGDCVCTRE